MSHKKYLLGLDLGSSSIKVSLVSAEDGKVVKSTHAPRSEMTIESPVPGWAEQDPAKWWQYTVEAVREVLTAVPGAGSEIEAIGVSYQMHGLVMFDSAREVLRPSIIWCDSRAVSAGDTMTSEIGQAYCFDHLLNEPGNFTAAKLRWVRDNEPDVFDKCAAIGLPGDYLIQRLSGELHMTASGLSEGIFWDFPSWEISDSVLTSSGAGGRIPSLVPSFGHQSTVSAQAAGELGLTPGVPVTYRAGDQPNNAISLKVTEPGQVAATAGTSGVVYAVTGSPAPDRLSRVNSFVHPNPAGQKRYGVLLCVNGSGIANSWIRQMTGETDYAGMNRKAAEVAAGADGLRVFPFGNGAERMFRNKDLGASITGLQFNRHSSAHMYRAVQEGVAFALKYGFDVLDELQCTADVIRASDANMFLSPLFSQVFTDVTNTTVEIYDTDGAKGAALAAGVGCGMYTDMNDVPLERLRVYEPGDSGKYKEIYSDWKNNIKL